MLLFKEKNVRERDENVEFKLCVYCSSSISVAFLYAGLKKYLRKITRKLYARINNDNRLFVRVGFHADNMECVYDLSICCFVCCGVITASHLSCFAIN